MIRFNCPNCGRLSEVPLALARLPLLCKGCGQPLVVPEASTAEPEPPPPPPPPRPAHKPPVLKLAKPDPVPPPPPPSEPDPEPEPEVEADPEPEPPPPPPKPKAKPPVRRKPVAVATVPVEPTAPPRRPRKNPLPVVIDVLVGALLLALGVYLGEVLAKKPTAQVWRDAGSAMTFPPEELILWLGPPSVVLLTYVLLASKGASVGGWLKRRTER